MSNSICFSCSNSKLNTVIIFIGIPKDILLSVPDAVIHIFVCIVCTCKYSTLFKVRYSTWIVTRTYKIIFMYRWSLSKVWCDIIINNCCCSSFSKKSIYTTLRFINSISTSTRNSIPCNSVFCSSNKYIVSWSST